jgi:uncharacterized membrane protein YbhN (UPF0104 family)
VISIVAYILMFLIAFLGIGENEDETGYNDRMGFIFFWLTCIVFSVSSGCLSAFPSERGMFMRE